MDMFSCDARYWTEKVQNDEDGSIGVRVFRERFGKRTDAAEVIYWDAAGGIAVKTLEGDVPIEVIEAAADEVRQLSGLTR